MKKKKKTTRFEGHISRAEMTEEIPPRKFDRHIRQARRNDIKSRRQVFVALSDIGEEREKKNGSITPMMYDGD